MEQLIKTKIKYNQLINKLIVYYNKYYNIIEHINLPNNQVYNILIKKNQNRIFTLVNNNNIYINRIYNSKINYISPITNILSNLINYINNKYFLIIAPNINLAELYLYNLKDIYVVLFIYNIYEIKSILLLKEKYKLQIDIYYIGKNLNYDSYITINDICNKYYKNIEFENIITDCGDTHFENNIIIIQIIGLLLTYKFLNNKSYYISLLRSPIINDKHYIYIINLLYQSFKFHTIYPNYIINRSFNLREIIYNFAIFYNFNNNKYIDTNILIEYLKDLSNLFNLEINNNDIDKNLCKSLTLNIKQDMFYIKELINIVESNITHKPKRLSYHSNSQKNLNYNMIPETINDISNKAEYIGDARDFQSRCHWGQKKLLLSEIQFLTKVCQKLNTKSLKNYAIVYAGAAHGNHFPVLYNLFPELIWLLYDPGHFSPESRMHPDKHKVKIFNQFFKDDTIQHAKKHSENRKILFISDIRLTPNEEAVMKDMISQAKWGTELGADFMLLKYKPPYDDEKTKPFKTNTINDLQLNPNLIINPNLKADDKTFLYFKGDVYLQVYAHIHSVELRLMVEKVNGKYELEKINYAEIEQKMFYFNTILRTSWGTDNYNLLNYIPGYDTSIECVMEFIIIKNYYEYFHNMNLENSLNDYHTVIQKMFDMSFILEKLAHTTFINCNYDTIIRTIKKFEKENDPNKLERLKLWKEISKFNIELSAREQSELISKNGTNILGEERVNKAIKYLEKYITDRNYIKIDI